MNATITDGAAALLIKMAVGAAIWASTNIYFGAFTIAFISALTRIVFEAECHDAGHGQCLKRLFRYFAMSAALAMLFVHVGIWQEWNNDMLIVVSSFFAFMSEETIIFVRSSWSKFLTKLLGNYAP